MSRLSRPNAALRALKIRLQRKWMVSKKDHDEIMRKEANRVNRWRLSLEDRHRKELHEAKAISESIVKETARIRFERGQRGPGHHSYRCIIEFDPDLHGIGGHYPDHLKHIAEYVGHMVEIEVASSRFVQTAHAEEQRRWERRNPPMNWTGGVPS